MLIQFVCSPLPGQPSEQAQEVRKACMLNICSCRLNLGQFDLCAKECTEVLATDRSNRKALYRRGSAYNGLARYTLQLPNLKNCSCCLVPQLLHVTHSAFCNCKLDALAYYRYSEAVKDLTQALDLSPANERDVVAAKLKEARDGAAKQPTAEVGLENKATTAAAATSSKTDRPLDRGDSTASSSQQGTSKDVQDGHVSDADSDHIEEIPAAPIAQQQEGAGQAAPSMPVAPFGMPPGMDPAQMQNMMRDPAMMKQMTDMMANMDPGQMESMARMAGAPGATPTCPFQAFIGCCTVY